MRRLIKAARHSKKGATPAQVALAWLMAQKPWIVPIPGTGNMDQLRENIGAIDVQLTPEDLRELEMGLARLELSGAAWMRGRWPRLPRLRTGWRAALRRSRLD
ncbi:aldo/keto reductase [Bradyrhizobium sp. WSM2254]|uniref:aldo/keto reductase n=1 Tax=Bradyrhizobium sp. WSM2254 TaxID=1188263 RepID=UPI0004809C7C|nr:aldo/keto reductase [Bradyrhizobium sp. WSM2254]